MPHEHDHNHQHSHMFHAENRKKLTSEERIRLLTPAETLRKLGYGEGGVFADIGCGTGLFTFPAADIGGGTAKFYAVDTSREMLDDITSQIAGKGYTTITVIKSDPYDFKLDDATADFILICSVLHEIDDKKRFIAEAKRICKARGKLAVIEFNENDNGFGPPPVIRMKPDQTAALLTEAGFTDIDTLDISAAYYAVTGIS